MNIKTRLIVSFTLLAALIILPNCISLFKISKNEKSWSEITVALEAANVRLTGIMASFIELRVEASKMGVFMLKEKDKSNPQIPTKRFHETIDKLKTDIASLSAISPKHKQYTDQIDHYREAFSNTYIQLSSYDEIGNKAYYYDKISKFITLHDSVNNNCKQTLVFLNNTILEQDRLARERENNTKKWLIIVMVLGIVIAFIALFSTLNSLLSPIRVMTKAINKVSTSDYDFRIKIKRADEFGQLSTAFNQMLDDLKHAKIIVDQKKELEHLNEELKIKNDSLDSFVYRVSHDLKAPIINITSLLGLVKKKLPADDKFLNQTFGFIDDSVKKLQATIYDLLEVSRIEKNLLTENEELDIDVMLSDVRAEFRELIRTSEVEILTDFNEGGQSVFYSKTSLKSILSNMVSNAIKYKSPNRKPVIKLSTTIEGDFLKLKIEDNGIGIDLERHGSKLFKMFSRFHSHVEGSGVGLYIVHKLMTDSGGKIKIESDLSKGTTFYLYFKINLKPAYV
jgi:signal transduction histidine kinase